MLKWLFAAALGATALPLAGAAQAAPPTWTATPCPGASGERKLECGILTVDEARGTASKRRIALPVAILRATDPKPGLPPVIYLPGGPGGSVFENVPAIGRGRVGRELIGVDQDWIFMEPRGAGQTVPRLDCGEVALNDAGPLTPEAVDALKACGQRLQAAGIDLSRYNAAEIARDVADLKQVLGLKQFDLFGGSYGTRLEFAIMTHAPQGLRAVVLDSPWPPEAKWTEGGPKLVSDAVKIIFARCAADPACAAKYPNVQADLDRLAREWLAGPLVKEGRTYTASDLGGFLMDQTYSARGARSLPRDIDKIAKGDLSPLDEQMAGRSGYDEGQHLTHLCKEEFPFEQRERVADGTQNDPVAGLLVASMQRYFDVCPAFAVGAANPIEQRPVTSDLPVLFLAAEIDPGCPPQFAEAAAKRLKNSQLVIVPNATHGVSSRSVCARKMVRDFLRDPARPVDRTCLSPEHDKFAFILE